MQYLKKAAEVIGNAMVRGITGCAVIYVLTYILRSMELPQLVGINVLNFIIMAFIVFLLVKGMNKLADLGKKEKESAAPTTKKCPYCKSEIAIDATRCPHCTSEVE